MGLQGGGYPSPDHTRRRLPDGAFPQRSEADVGHRPAIHRPVCDVPAAQEAAGLLIPHGKPAEAERPVGYTCPQTRREARDGARAHLTTPMWARQAVKIPAERGSWGGSLRDGANALLHLARPFDDRTGRPPRGVLHKPASPAESFRLLALSIIYSGASNGLQRRDRGYKYRKRSGRGRFYIQIRIDMRNLRECPPHYERSHRVGREPGPLGPLRRRSRRLPGNLAPPAALPRLPGNSSGLPGNLEAQRSLPGNFFLVFSSPSSFRCVPHPFHSILTSLLHPDL